MYLHRTHVKHTPVFYTIVQEINKNKLRSMPLRIKPFFVIHLTTVQTVICK